jgi:hypothetical protein
MGLLGRLIGKEAPHLPAGGRAYASLDPDGSWCIRVAMNGEDPSPRCKKISPRFDLQTTAYAYLDWVTGAAPSFSYPEGVA